MELVVRANVEISSKARPKDGANLGKEPVDDRLFG
jgi:hypothetical protein